MKKVQLPSDVNKYDWWVALSSTYADLRTLLNEMRDERIRDERQNRYLLEDAFFGAVLRLGSKLFKL